MKKIDQKRMKRERNEFRMARLKALIDEKYDGINARVANKAGLPESYISRMLYEEGKSQKKNVTEGMIEKIESGCDVPGWFSGKDDKHPVLINIDTPPDGYIRLEHLSQNVSMGRGIAVYEMPKIVQHLDVLEQWVRNIIGITNTNRVKIMTGIGNSMLPAIKDQDLVFIDIEHRHIDYPGIYVVDVAGRLLLKRVMIQSNGTLIIRSDNTEEFPDEERYDIKNAGDITICGKYLARWTLEK